jgi:hypothetical protein
VGIGSPKKCAFGANIHEGLIFALLALISGTKSPHFVRIE